MKRTTLFVVGAGQHVLKHMRLILDDTCRVVSVEAGQEALGRIRAERPHLVVLDLATDSRTSSSDAGLDLLEGILSCDDLLKVIVVSNGEHAQAARAIRKGAFDVCRKPLDLDELRIAVQRALHIRRLEEENEMLHAHLDQARSSLSIIGACPEMEEISGLIRDVSNSDVPVLIQGERGTGKELAARVIHSLSPRGGKPFVVVNCRALPEHLAASELFGHEEGAFAGAQTLHRGKIEMAEGGTLLLDDVEALPDSLQIRLLDLIREGKSERLGGTSSMDLDVRIVSSTRGNLRAKMEAGSFREDLYYYLEVVSLTLPPLRARGDDVSLLASAFLGRFSDELGKQVEDFARDADLAMRLHAWPGNVRELENKVKRGVILTRDAMVSARHLGLHGADGGERRPRSLKEARRELDIRCIRNALEKHRGVVSRAARELCISRVSLHNLIKKYSLR